MTSPADRTDLVERALRAHQPALERSGDFAHECTCGALFAPPFHDIDDHTQHQAEAIIAALDDGATP